MAKTARKPVTLAAPVAPQAPATVTKATYVAPALVSTAAPAQSATQAAIKFLQASLGVAPAPQVPPAPATPVAPQATITRATGVSQRTAATWARSVPQGNLANLMLPKVSANFAPAQTVTVLRANPKAAGKAPHYRYSLYTVACNGGNTCTVGQYLAVCAAKRIAPATTHADLMWDVNHGYISVA